MAKSDLPFSMVNLSRVWRGANKPRWARDRRINGFDTETCGNEPVVLSYAWDGLPGEVIENDTALIPSTEIFRMLTHKSARGALNVWYNLDFDANVILAHLPRHVVYHIGIFGSDSWGGYEITYLKKKLLCIKDANRHKVEHFDVASIFFQVGGSLNGAANAWLGETKLDDGLDRSRFSDRSYLREHWGDIIPYAKRDAELVRDVWRAFCLTAEPLDIPCAKPFSTGYLAEQAYNVEFRRAGNRKPGFVDEAFQEFAWRSYRGGRFEVIERGELGEVVTIDINSAYPNVLRTLPDPATVSWNRATNPKWTELKGADYGFIRALVSTDPARPLQPFARKSKGRLTFPILSASDVTVTLPEFIFAVESGLIGDFRVTDSWLGHKTEHTIFPFDFVNAIYARRQQLKRDGNDKAQAVLKIIINSLYGKLAQLTETTERTPSGAQWGEKWIWAAIEAFPPHLRTWLESEGIEIHRTVKSGAYFNPMIASYITGLTRLQLIQTAIENGIENHVKILATDSLCIGADGFDNSGLANECDASGLGRWDIEGRGTIFCVGSGVYELTDGATGKTKARTRGFEAGFGVYGMDLKGVTLREAARQAVYDPERKQSVIPISNVRPLKIGQALWQNIELSQVGVFSEFPRGLSAGMDQKREWPRGQAVTWAELLEGSERSFPLRDGD